MEERAGRHWEKELIKAAAAARKRYVCSYGQGDLYETVCVHACRVCRSRRALCVWNPSFCICARPSWHQNLSRSEGERKEYLHVMAQPLYSTACLTPLRGRCWAVRALKCPVYLFFRRSRTLASSVHLQKQHDVHPILP